MPFPAPHLYLTAHWTDSREPNESGQFGIRFFTTATEVTQGMVDAAWAPMETFWTAVGAKIPAPYNLRSLRLALVAENGQNVPGTFSRDFGVFADVVLPPRPAADDGDANAADGRAARLRRRRARPAAPREGIHNATCYPSNAAKAKPWASDDGSRKVRFRSKTAGKVAQWAFAVKNCLR